MRALRGARYASWGAFAAIVLSLAYLSRLQFLTWQADAVTRYLLPPYRPAGYFFGYVWLRLWAPYALSACVAAVAYAAASFANRRRGGVFFEYEEPYFLATGILMAGHPGWVAYVVLTLGAYLAVSAVRFAFIRRAERISFYRFWLPCAAVVVALEAVFSGYGWYADLFL